MTKVANLLNGKLDSYESCDDYSWRELIRYLIGTINAWVGYEIETEALDHACTGNGFCIDVLRACPPSGELLHWKGILGGSIVDGRLRVSLLMFMYSFEQRLIAKGGAEFAEYVYELDECERGQWVLDGWFEDEYGEYDHFS